MKFPLSWLRDWVELPAKIDEVSALLIKVGVELEAVEDPAAHMEHVVVGRVLKREAHPAADKLSLCQVSDGTQTLQIVCGAKNFKEGDLVPLAQEGAVLPSDFKIKRSKIRGVESFGMLCSSEELGLGKGEDGLLILAAGLKEGTPLAEALGLNDPVFDVATTANRPDHLSVRGLAREIAAVTGKPLKPAEIKVSEGGEPVDKAMQASVADAEACPLYMARIVRGLKVAPSPDWLKRRLEGAGIRAINNVVDATNYVLIEYGQPLHAFDLKKLTGGRVEARLAKAGESLKTLDGAERALQADDLVIADAKGPVALAGVMGGAETQVELSTTDILLEAAVFKPIQLRRTSRRLGLRSESSLRFERGVDASSTEEAMNRAASLLCELASGTAAPGRLSAGPGRPQALEVMASVERINALLGTTRSAEAIKALLEKRGFTVSASGDQLAVRPPSHRADVALEADLAEEVAHLGGLENVVSTDLPEVRTPDADADEWSNSWILRARLSGAGLREASTLSYLDPQLAGHWGFEKLVKIDNPLSEELSLLRPSLLPMLVASALESMKHKAPGAALYELGRVFSPGIEEARLGVVLAGAPSQGNWAAKARDFDFYGLKGIAEGLAQGLGFGLRSQVDAKAPAFLHPGQSARIQMGPMSGWMGALHPGLAKKLDARAPVFLLELEGWAKEPLSKARKFKEYSELPQVERDLSCLVDAAFEAGKLLEVLKREGFGGSQARVKDVFQGAPLPEGKKSLTVALTYLAGEQTLTDDEVNRRHGELSAKLKAALPLEIRD